MFKDKKNNKQKLNSSHAWTRGFRRIQGSCEEFPSSLKNKKSGNEEGVWFDPLFNFRELKSEVRDRVQLLLSAYGDIESGKLNITEASAQVPQKISVILPGSQVESIYFLRKSLASYYAPFDDAFNIAKEILKVNGRAFLMLFPKHERLLSRVEIVRSLVHWTLSALEDTWVKEVKNVLLTTFARAEKQPVPDFNTPHKCRIFFGRFGEEWYKSAFGYKRKNLMWRNTILHGIKKGLPTVSDSFIEESLKKHSDLLRTDQECDKHFLRLVEEVSKFVFKDVQLKDHSLGFKVTSSACIEQKKSDFGTLGSIRALEFSRIPYLVFMDYHPRLGVTEWHSNKYSDLDEYRKMNFNNRSLWGVEIIREPLKVRVITKGETLSNGVWSDIQKQMLSALNRFRCFRLTEGQTVEDNNGLPEPFLRKEKDFTYISGDYSSATDSIKRDVMIAATVGIRDHILRTHIVNNLSNGTISYESICERMGFQEIPTFEQVRGQLMGSIFSFPILCLINLCTYLWAVHKMEFKDFIELYGPEANYSLSYLINYSQVLVNGDDILFYSPSNSFYQDWLEGTKHAGFILSVGKSYNSRKFMLVNSRYLTSRQRAIPYINMGLCFGRQKGIDSRVDSPKSYREKMAKLPGYFKDLWKDFSVRDTQLRIRIIKTIRACRQDLQRSGWADFTVGLHCSYGGISSLNATPILQDLKKIQSGNCCMFKPRTDSERSAYWFAPRSIDTEILRFNAKVSKDSEKVHRQLQFRILSPYIAKIGKGFGTKDCSEVEYIEQVQDRMARHYHSFSSCDRLGNMVRC